MANEIKRTPEGVIIAKPIASKCFEPFMANLKVVFDKETGSTSPDESDLVNLDDLIQTYKDQCGMELARKLIATGQATEADFADDGQHSGSVDPFLESAQGRANAAIKAREQADSIAKALDLPDNAAALTEEQLTAIISKTIQDKYPGIIKQEVKNDAE